MNIEILNEEFSVCKTNDKETILNLLSSSSNELEYVFYARTDVEESIVCPTSAINFSTTNREDEWRGFRITGELDFGLVGILSKISGLLAENNISIYAVSTYNTDYIFVKKVHLQNAMNILESNQYTILNK